MAYLRYIWQWIAGHWTLTFASASIAAITAASMFFQKWRKARAETAKAEAEAEALKLRLEQARLAWETGGHGQTLQIYANWKKEKVGSHDVEFSEDELRHALGPNGDRLHAVLEMLRQEGKARKGTTPGYWNID